MSSLRKLKKKEIIKGLTKALEFYRDGKHLNENDTWGDDCSGLYGIT